MNKRQIIFCLLFQSKTFEFRYGQQSLQHGQCSRLTNVKTSDVKLKQNERIRRINVYKGFDGRIIGLQFKINNHETDVFGNKSKLVHPIKDPYNSPMFYCQYFIGKFVYINY